MASKPVANPYSEIDSLFKSLREISESSALHLVPGIPDVSPQWLWSGEFGNEHEFVEIARQAEVRLMYYELECFDLESIIRLQLHGTDLLSGDDEEDESIVSAAQHALAKWSSRIGENATVSLRFFVDGVVHDLRILTEWFDRFIEEITQYIDTLEEQWEEGQTLESEAGAKEKRRKAETLARSDRYARAKNDAQRRYVADEIFPDDDELGIRKTLELAALIYWDKVEPEREQDLAKRVVELRATGMNMSEVAAQVGVTKDRANRLIAIAEIVDSGFSPPQTPLTP